MRNKGNNALLQAAMQRMQNFWPQASLGAITFAPNLLRMYYPYATPIDPANLRPIQSRFDRYSRWIPVAFRWAMFEWREEVWHRRHTRERLSQSHMVTTPDHLTSEFSGVRINAEDARRAELKKALSQFDIYVATGGGYMCDSDKRMLLDVFDRLEAAIAVGIPTVLVGQGIGPLKDLDLLARAREILPAVDLIFYRNRPNGLPLLQSFNVPAERLFLTGDDAVEMAYENRQPALGNGIGVSLRVAHYTQIEKGHIELVRQVLHTIAKLHRAQLVAIPISSAHHESDITHIRQILDGYERVSISWRKLDSPVDTIKRVRRCRLVVTGTYHGAIFALAQGIPVIGIARSDEYFDKLSELCDEFPGGIQVFRLGDAQLSEKLAGSIEDAWQRAEDVRPSLLASALRQIEWQHAAYQRIYELMNQRGRNLLQENDGKK
jgi:polysaccharide pyruvyl transferase WcaK-like protein